MKHYYCYCEEPGMLCPASRVFKVAIGDCDRDRMKKALLDCYATDNGFFFRVWDDTTDFELQRKCSWSDQDCYSRVFPFEVVVVSVSKLYAAIIDGSLAEIKNPPHYFRNALRMRSILSPSFFFRLSSSKNKPTAPSPRRKNLNHVLTEELVNTIIGGMIVTAIFLFVGFLDGLQRCM